MQLRDYQQRCVEAVLNAWGIAPYHDGTRDAVRSTLANLATSAGKTVIAAKIIEEVTKNSSQRCLFMVDADELAQQAIHKLRSAAGIYAGVEKASDRTSLNSQVVVGSAQTLARPNRLERFPRDHFDYIIVDEAHRGAERNKKITDYFENARVLGLTATAFRKKLANLSDFYEDVCFELGVFDLIGQGYITPIKVLTLPIQVDLTKVREAKSFGEKDYNEQDLSESIEPWYEAIAQAIIEHAPKRHIVSYLPLVRSSQRFVEICQGAGINAIHVDGQDPLRKQKLERFARGEFQLMSNSSLLTTGWDCHIADCMLNLRPTQSTGLFRQMAGRFIRVLEGVIDGITDPAERIARIAASAKPDALILDLLWQTEELGLVGPASLIADSEEEARAIQTRLRLSKNAEELSQVQKEYQKDVEDQLRRKLEERAKRFGGLMDPREVGLLLGDRKLMEYEPLFKWEKAAVSPKQAKLIETIGVNPEAVEGRGHASKLLDAILSRQKQGLAPLEAFKALTERGIEHPETVELDEAIRLLREDFPMTFGKKHRGKPLAAVPAGFWAWMWQTYQTEYWMREQEKQHPAAFRYMKKIMLPSQEATLV